MLKRLLQERWPGRRRTFRLLYNWIPLYWVQSMINKVLTQFFFHVLNLEFSNFQTDSKTSAALTFKLPSPRPCALSAPGSFELECKRLWIVAFKCVSLYLYSLKECSGKKQDRWVCRVWFTAMSLQQKAPTARGGSNILAKTDSFSGDIKKGESRIIKVTQ